MKAYIIPNPQRRFVSLLLMNIVLFIASLFLLTQSQVRSSQSAPLGWLVVCLCFASIPWLIGQSCDTRPYLIADERGLWYRPFGLGYIPWDEIQGITLKSIMGTKIICLELNHVDSWLSKLPIVHCLVAKLNQAVGFPIFNINLSRIGMRVEDVFARITEIQNHENFQL